MIFLFLRLLRDLVDLFLRQSSDLLHHLCALETRLHLGGWEIGTAFFLLMKMPTKCPYPQSTNCAAFIFHPRHTIPMVDICHRKIPKSARETLVVLRVSNKRAGILNTTFIVNNMNFEPHIKKINHRRVCRKSCGCSIKTIEIWL